MLETLTARWPGLSSYWIYLDKGQVYCFNRVDGASALPLGFASGSVAPHEATCLAACADVLCSGAPPSPHVWFEHGGLCSLLVERHNARGQKLGYVGVSVPRHARDQIDAAEAARLIQEHQ